MNTANGTLRHHLDVLQTRKAVTVMPVNGRTCYFAGGPSQVEVLRSKVVGEERMAQQLPIGLSPVQRMIIENIDREGVPRSQAALARRLGRTRATVHRAVKLLRRRGTEAATGAVGLRPRLDCAKVLGERVDRADGVEPEGPLR